MRQRLEAAREQSGLDQRSAADAARGLNERIVVGTWQTRADWERWHESEAFSATRERLNQLEVADQDMTWHETILALAQR